MQSFSALNKCNRYTTMPNNATYKLNYYDADGRRRGKTFTARTKTLARDLAREWLNIYQNKKGPFMTLSEALDAFLNAKRAVLSPATLRSYEGMRKNHFHSIEKMDIYELRNADVQMWISDLVDAGLKPKTVRNCYGFLTAVLAMQDESIRFNVKLPQKRPVDYYCPNDSDISILLEQIKRDGDSELLRAVLLAAFGPCRRSEVCAMTSDDIHGNIVTINKAVVKDSNGKWIVKPPKTSDSVRRIDYPDFVIKACAGINGPIIPHTPDYIGDKFRKTLKAAKLPHFRFHDLRHYGASIMAYMVSQSTIERRGGWHANSPVLKRVYQHAIEEKERQENEKINAYFEKFEANLK